MAVSPLMSNISCISPVDGALFASRPVMPKAEVLGTIARARTAQLNWQDTPLATRIKIVLSGMDVLSAQKEAAALEVSHMMGRPKGHFFEFEGCHERISYMAKIAPDALAPIIIEDSAQFGRRIEREPQGLILVVAPWNYPYLTAMNTIGPALIAGNALVLKHAAQTMLAGERICDAFVAGGLPAGLLQNVFLDHATTSTLIGEDHFDMVNFTGSVGGGQAMEQAAAGTFTAVGTELGGKDPAYVMDDADIDTAVASLMDGAFFNAGQCCCGIERIYVHDSLYDAFLSKAVAVVGALKLGNPLEDGTTLGPMANARFANGVRDQIADAIAGGATALIEPADFPQDDGGAYLAPQILVDVTHDMRVMREESFGPVVGIMRVSSDEEAIALMNDSEFGLTASLWTQDPDRAARIGRRIETGTVFMNRCDYLDPAVCWTGRKNTGRGTTLSALGFDAVTRPKSYHFKK